MLSENHAEDMGDYEALVIVQAANFTEGEVLLYERLNMVPMLLEEYAKSGTDRSRRQMLAMCEHNHDPEIYADVLAYFVKMATEKLNGVCLLATYFCFISLSSHSFFIFIIHRQHLRKKPVWDRSQSLVASFMTFMRP